MSRHEDRCSSDNHLEDTRSGYAHASKHHSSRFLTSWGQMRPFLARPLDALSTERRSAGPRATFYIRRLIPITLVFGACVWLVSWASPPPSRNVLPPPPPPPTPPPTPPPSLDATVVHPGIFGVCPFVHLFIVHLNSAFRRYTRSTPSFRNTTPTSSGQRAAMDGPF